jgi:O-antigen biosynthesis protein
MIDIIIPFFNQTKLLLNCLKSIRQHTANYNLILIDNGSTEKIEEITIRNESNLGYPKAINQGLKISSAEFVVLLNSDTEVCANWIDLLKAPFYECKTVGAVGPLSTAKTQWQGLITTSSKWEHACQPLSFFCVMLSKAAICSIGFLDEDFGIGFGEDTDYCNRLKHHGFSVILQRRLRIKHVHRQTFRSIMSEKEINRQLKISDMICRNKLEKMSCCEIPRE